MGWSLPQGPSGPSRWQYSPSLWFQRLPCWWGPGVTAELSVVIPSWGEESVCFSLHSCPHHRPTKLPVASLPFVGIRQGPLRAPESSLPPSQVGNQV